MSYSYQRANAALLGRQIALRYGIPQYDPLDNRGTKLFTRQQTQTVYLAIRSNLPPSSSNSESNLLTLQLNFRSNLSINSTIQ